MTSLGMTDRRTDGQMADSERKHPSRSPTSDNQVISRASSSSQASGSSEDDGKRRCGRTGLLVHAHTQLTEAEKAKEIAGAVD